MIHGTRTAYINGCRCEECRAAHAAYEADRRRRRMDGDGVDRRTRRVGLVDATKARSHVSDLVDRGWTSAAIAVAADVSERTVTRIRSGASIKVDAATSHAVCSVPLFHVAKEPECSGCRSRVTVHDGELRYHECNEFDPKECVQSC